MQEFREIYFKSDFEEKEKLYSELKEEFEKLGEEMPDDIHNDFMETLKTKKETPNTKLDMLSENLITLIENGISLTEKQWIPVKEIQDFDNLETIPERISRFQEKIIEHSQKLNDIFNDNLDILEDHEDRIQDFVEENGFDSGDVFLRRDTLEAYYITEDGKVFKKV